MGRFARSQDVIGEWPGLTRKDEVITLEQAFINHGVNADVYDDLETFKRCDLSGYDAVVLTLGEAGNEAGEGHSKVDITLHVEDTAWLESVKDHPRVVSVVYAGRPLIITPLAQHTHAILYAYQPGTMNGEAVTQLLFGLQSPSGKLTMTFPSHAGQIPLYYNHLRTGRPLNPQDPHYRYRSHYIDHSNDPLYPFGHGLTYGRVLIERLTLDQTTLEGNASTEVTIDVFNDSSVAVEEVVQIYIEAQSFSVSRPVLELKRFERVALAAHAKQTLTFTLSVDDFRSYNQAMEYRAEQRTYTVKAGLSSHTTHEHTIQIND